MPKRDINVSDKEIFYRHYQPSSSLESGNQCLGEVRVLLHPKKPRGRCLSNQLVISAGSGVLLWCRRAELESWYEDGQGNVADYSHVPLSWALI